MNPTTINGKQTPQIRMSVWFLFGSESVDAFMAYSEGIGFWSGDVSVVKISLILGRETSN